MDRWIGRTALVTGSHSGIGAAISKALIKHQMNVIGCDKLKQLSDCLEGPGIFVPILCDVSKEDDVIEVMKIVEEKFGGVDVCVNNAGVTQNTTILEGSIEKWKHIVETNILGKHVKYFFT